MSEPVTLEGLRRLSFLRPATDEELQQLVTVARGEGFAAGTVLFREGDRLLHFSIIVSGIVAIEILGPARRLQRIHTVREGELLGWSPVLGSGAMSATARAVTDVNLISIDASAVLAVCESDPRFGSLFMRRVAAAIASRLYSTRLQLLDVFGGQLPVAEAEGAGA
jgi:CRP-like cAMP-binding protein